MRHSRFQLRVALVGPGDEGSGRSQDFRSHSAQVSVSEDAQWNAIAEFGIDSCQPGLNYPGRVVLAQRTHDLIGETQPLLYVSRGFGLVDPWIKRLNVVHPGDVCREFWSENLCQTSDYFRPSQANASR